MLNPKLLKIMQGVKYSNHSNKVMSLKQIRQKISD